MFFICILPICVLRWSFEIIFATVTSDLSAPGVAALTTAAGGEWAAEYLDTEGSTGQPGWSAGAVEGDGVVVAGARAGIAWLDDDKWAEEYLDQTEHRPWCVKKHPPPQTRFGQT